MQKFFLAAFHCSIRVAAAATRSCRESLIVLALLTFTTVVVADSVSNQTGVSAVSDSRPVVYLTFDDGPSADFVTAEVLQVLARHHATATFFVTGQRVRREPGKIAEIVYAGHAIGNHTVNHAKLTLVSDAQVVSELRGASKMILAAGGPPATCFRPPFGSTDSRINKLADSLGMVPVGWSIDTRDWERSITIDAISNALDRTADDSVVLLHDGPAHRFKMLQAFKAWMDTEAHRFQFRALPECTPHGVPGGGAVQLARLEQSDESLSDVPPVNVQDKVVSMVERPADKSAQHAAAADSDSEVSYIPAATKIHTIPELLEKIRAYRFVLHDDGRPVDLTQVTATLSSEIHGDHIYYSF